MAFLTQCLPSHLFFFRRACLGVDCFYSIFLHWFQIWNQNLKNNHVFFKSFFRLFKKKISPVIQILPFIRFIKLLVNQVLSPQGGLYQKIYKNTKLNIIIFRLKINVIGNVNYLNKKKTLRNIKISIKKKH